MSFACRDSPVQSLACVLRLTSWNAFDARSRTNLTNWSAPKTPVVSRAQFVLDCLGLLAACSWLEDIENDRIKLTRLQLVISDLVFRKERARARAQQASGGAAAGGASHAVRRAGGWAPGDGRRQAAARSQLASCQIELRSWTSSARRPGWREKKNDTETSRLIGCLCSHAQVCFVLMSYSCFAFQLRDLESELEEERKQKASALAAKKKIEMDYNDLESQIEGASKMKEDAIKQWKKAQVCRPNSLLNVWHLPGVRTFSTMLTFASEPLERISSRAGRATSITWRASRLCQGQREKGQEPRSWSYSGTRGAGRFGKAEEDSGDGSGRTAGWIERWTEGQVRTVNMCSRKEYFVYFFYILEHFKPMKSGDLKLLSMNWRRKRKIWNHLSNWWMKRSEN